MPDDKSNLVNLIVAALLVRRVMKSATSPRSVISAKTKCVR
jgi:hypothetical protein